MSPSADLQPRLTDAFAVDWLSRDEWDPGEKPVELERINHRVGQDIAHISYRRLDRSEENGETFYVGKGRGNRVFAHIHDEQSLDRDDLSNKLKRIREIRLAGFEVAHVIHRHGMDDPTAFEVEAALMDAYPGLAHQVPPVQVVGLAGDRDNTSSAWANA